MAEDSTADTPVRFGAFTVDLKAGELYRRGVKLPLTGIPFQILEALIERPGEVVPREALRQRIWGDDTYVDFDNSLNSAVNRLRQALDDSAAHPRFIETVPRRGYRFLSPVERPLFEPPPVEPPDVSPPPVGRALGLRLFAAVCLLIFGVTFGFLAIRAARSPAPMPDERLTIAVLPFRDLNAQPDPAYLAAGLTEEMITELGRRQPQRLGVIATTSALRYANTDKSATEIGRELGVDYLLEGSVRRETDRARVTTQLIRVQDQSHLWSETYERSALEVLALHTSIARSIANAVEQTLTPRAPRRRETARDVEPEAYEAYLQGRYAWNRRNPESLGAARQHFERAIAIDPDYALPYVGLAETYLVMHSYLLLSAQEALPRARSAALRALELDGDLAEANAALAGVRLQLEWDLTAAGEGYRRAIDLHPSYATARQWYAEYLTLIGRHDEAIAEIQRAAELDPLSLVIRTMQGAIYYFARRWDEADAALDRALALDPDFRLANVLIACIATGRGESERAISRLERLAQDSIGVGDEELLLAYAYAEAGRRQDALTIVNRRADTSDRRPSAYHQALVQLALGERESALDLLERAYEQHDRWLLFIQVDPRLDPLREEARFQTILRRLSFPKA